MSEKTPTDSYKSILNASTGIYKESGSKFLAFAYPVSTEEEIKELILTTKKEYFDARHHCYAYRLGLTGVIWRANDDGEPSSTGGKPILGQLLSNELSDVLIIVVRYFGGVKLGIPGLIKAYRSAAIDSIANAKIIEKLAYNIVEISFDYNQMNPVMKILKDYSAQIIDQSFDNLCKIKFKIRARDFQLISIALVKVDYLNIINMN